MGYGSLRHEALEDLICHRRSLGGIHATHTVRLQQAPRLRCAVRLYRETHAQFPSACINDPVPPKRLWDCHAFQGIESEEYGTFSHFADCTPATTKFGDGLDPPPNLTGVPLGHALPPTGRQ